MERQRMNQLLVGIFVVLGVSIATYLIFVMGSRTGVFRSTFTVYARFKDVKGLHPGSEVSLSGLRVGIVKEITVATDDSKEMVAHLQISSTAKDRIRADSAATLRTQGVLGDRYIELTIGSNSQRPLKNGDTLRTEEASDIFAKSGSLMEGLSRYLREGGDIDSLVKNLAKLSDNLVQLSGQVKKEKSLLNELFYGSSGKNLNEALTHLDSILKKIDGGDGTLGSLVNDPTVYEDVKSVLGGAKRSSVLKYFMRQFIESSDKEKEELDKTNKLKKSN
ncbi:MCE family protein [bacterium]|nr:MCE family protein [bacterium]NBW98336.1 MCE family protein [bacterium]NBX82116.1 MCE family protein [bacterium]